MVFDPEKTGRFPVAGEPVVEVAQLPKTVKLSITLVASATWPLLIGLGTAQVANEGDEQESAATSTKSRMEYVEHLDRARLSGRSVRELKFQVD